MSWFLIKNSASFLAHKIYAFFVSNFFIRKSVYSASQKLSNFSTGLKTANQFEKIHFQYLSGNVN